MWASLIVHYMKSSFEELLGDLQIISKELFLSSWNFVSTTNLNTAFGKQLTVPKEERDIFLLRVFRSRPAYCMQKPSMFAKQLPVIGYIHHNSVIAFNCA